MKKILYGWYEELTRASLTLRFAIAAALMAIVVLIATGVSSWWLSNLELEAASRALQKKKQKQVQLK